MTDKCTSRRRSHYSTATRGSASSDLKCKLMVVLYAEDTREWRLYFVLQALELGPWSAVLQVSFEFVEI